MKTPVLGLAAAGLMACGCATAPEKVSAAYVSPAQYAGFDCDQIRVELQRVAQRVARISGQQRRKHDQDAAAVTVGIVVLWPALFFQVGDEHKDELALLKGEYEALGQSAVEKRCPVAEEIAAAGAK